MNILLVLPKPTRFDAANFNQPLSGGAGTFIRTMEDKHGVKFDTIYAAEFNDAYAACDRMLFTGEGCLKLIGATRSLDAERGLVQRNVMNGVPMTITYAPQDCVDLRNYENEEAEAEDDDDTGTGKDTAPTSRKNYRGWFERDLVKLIANPARQQAGRFCQVGDADAIRLLGGARGRRFYFDLESHPDTNTLQCFSFAIDDGPVYAVCVYGPDGKRRCSLGVLAALATALKSCALVVIHNAAFDLTFLALYHRMPVIAAPVWCTMSVHHRLFTELEKSLAHVISLYTNHPFHKDTAGTFNPRNWAQAERLMRYNATDVWTLRDVHLAQEKHVADNPRYAPSVAEVNAIQVPYMLAGLHGFPYSATALRRRDQECKRRAKYLQRILNILIGREINVNSSAQVAKYLHQDSGYRIVKTTESGAPSVGADTLYRLLAEYPDNKALMVMLEMRRVSKLASMLAFKPMAWEFNLT